MLTAGGHDSATAATFAAAEGELAAHSGDVGGVLRNPRLELLLPLLDEPGGGVRGRTGDVMLSCGELASWLMSISPG
jgi:hypothetical protein